MADPVHTTAPASPALTPGIGVPRRLHRMVDRASLRIAMAITCVLTASAVAQDWELVSLPARVPIIKAAGDPLTPGAIAVWGLRNTEHDTAARMYVTPWVFCTTTNAGSSWHTVDSGFFSRSTAVPLMTNWHQLAFVGGTIVRSTTVTTAPNATSYAFQRSDGGGPFLRGDYPGPVDMDMGSPTLHLAGQGVSFNLRHEQGQDSVSMALYRSGGPGMPWSIVPDSLRGFHSMPTPTTIAFRALSTNIMYLGTRDGLYMSGNAGATWSRLRTDTPLDRSVISLVAIHPREANLVYATGRSTRGEAYHHLYRSTDNGSRWTEVLSDTLFTHIALPAVSVASVLVGTQSSILASVDTGITWKSVSANLPQLTGMNSLQSLFADPSDGTVYAALPSALYRNDGWFRTVGIERVTSADDGMSLDVYPNPCVAGSPVTVRLSAPGATRTAISIIDALGRIVWSSACDVTAAAGAGCAMTLPGRLTERITNPFYISLETSTGRIMKRCSVLR